MTDPGRHALCLKIMVACLAAFTVAVAAIVRHPEWFS
jgi:hypothetical protein